LPIDEEKRNRIRNQEFGFVFQFHYLLPEFSAIENIILPGLIRGESESRLRQRAEELLNDLRLMGRKDAKPYRLSGGEQQRVAVARSLINQPEIVFMDEPTGNLDPRHSEEMIDMVLQQKQKHQLAIVMVTHSHEIARKADRHLTLRQGKLFPAS
ncbi:MAG: ATP-binding cassette domain-containing protein, partial [bacterium]|nr:ATP-binding cassette domain-containing protein [bacterium]